MFAKGVDISIIGCPLFQQWGLHGDPLADWRARTAPRGADDYPGVMSFNFQVPSKDAAVGP
ncbi:hypothetical protein GCM10009761_32080 [Agromyces terreus]